jgi:FKBP-type peptidyl-prolyl cis-trans isomerase (trigger factor)
MADYSYKLNKTSNTKIELNVTINKNLYDEEKGKQLNKLSYKVNMPGFRPGKAPKDVVEVKLGSELLEKTVESILPKVTLEILKENKYEKIISVKYDISKMDFEKGLEYKAIVYIYHDFTLPEFSKIKVKEDEVKVVDEELNEFYNNFIKEFEPKDKKNDEKPSLTIDKITDEWVKEKKFPKINTVQELKDFLKKLHLQEKENKVKSKFLNEIIEKLSKESNIEVPEVLIEWQLDEREKQDKVRLEKLGIKWEDWLKQQKTDENEVKKIWSEEISNSIKRQLLISKLAEVSKVAVTEEEAEKVLLGINGYNKLGDEEAHKMRHRMMDQIFEQKLEQWIMNEFKKKD